MVKSREYCPKFMGDLHQLMKPEFPDRKKTTDSHSGTTIAPILQTAGWVWWWLHSLQLHKVRTFFVSFFGFSWVLAEKIGSVGFRIIFSYHKDYDFVGLAEIWVFKPLTFPKSAALSVHVPYEIHGQSMSWVYLTSTGSQEPQAIKMSMTRSWFVALSGFCKRWPQCNTRYHGACDDVVFWCCPHRICG